MKTEKRYSEKQLVSFANYVLSIQRNNNLTITGVDKTVVYDADLANWKEKHSRDKITKAIIKNTKSF